MEHDYAKISYWLLASWTVDDSDLEGYGFAIPDRLSDGMMLIATKIAENYPMDTD